MKVVARNIKNILTNEHFDQLLNQDKKGLFSFTGKTTNLSYACLFFFRHPKRPENWVKVELVRHSCSKYSLKDHLPYMQKEDGSNYENLERISDLTNQEIKAREEGQLGYLPELMDLLRDQLDGQKTVQIGIKEFDKNGIQVNRLLTTLSGFDNLFCSMLESDLFVSQDGETFQVCFRNYSYNLCLDQPNKVMRMKPSFSVELAAFNYHFGESCYESNSEGKVINLKSLFQKQLNCEIYKIKALKLDPKIEIIIFQKSTFEKNWQARVWSAKCLPDFEVVNEGVFDTYGDPTYSIKESEINLLFDAQDEVEETIEMYGDLLFGRLLISSGGSQGVLYDCKSGQKFAFDNCLFSKLFLNSFMLQFKDHTSKLYRVKDHKTEEILLNEDQTEEILSFQLQHQEVEIEEDLTITGFIFKPYQSQLRVKKKIGISDVQDSIFLHEPKVTYKIPHFLTRRGIKGNLELFFTNLEVRRVQIDNNYEFNFAIQIGEDAFFCFYESPYYCFYKLKADFLKLVQGESKVEFQHVSQAHREKLLKNENYEDLNEELAEAFKVHFGLKKQDQNIVQDYQKDYNFSRNLSFFEVSKKGLKPAQKDGIIGYGLRVKNQQKDEIYLLQEDGSLYLLQETSEKLLLKETTYYVNPESFESLKEQTKNTGWHTYLARFEISPDFTSLLGSGLHILIFDSDILGRQERVGIPSLGIYQTYYENIVKTSKEYELQYLDHNLSMYQGFSYPMCFLTQKCFQMSSFGIEGILEISDGQHQRLLVKHQFASQTFYTLRDSILKFIKVIDNFNPQRIVLSQDKTLIATKEGSQVNVYKVDFFEEKSMVLINSVEYETHLTSYDDPANEEIQIQRLSVSNQGDLILLKRNQSYLFKNKKQTCKNLKYEIAGFTPECNIIVVSGSLDNIFIKDFEDNMKFVLKAKKFFKYLKVFPFILENQLTLGILCEKKGQKYIKVHNVTDNTQIHFQAVGESERVFLGNGSLILKKDEAIYDLIQGYKITEFGQITNKALENFEKGIITQELISKDGQIFFCNEQKLFFRSTSLLDIHQLTEDQETQLIKCIKRNGLNLGNLAVENLALQLFKLKFHKEVKEAKLTVNRIIQKYLGDHRLEEESASLFLTEIEGESLFQRALKSDTLAAKRILAALTEFQARADKQALVIKTSKDFDKLLKYPAFLQYLNLCQKPTVVNKGLINAPWGIQEREKCFRSSNGEPPQMLNQKLQGSSQEETSRKVQLTCIKLDFLSKDQEVISFAQVLAKQSNNEIFRNQVIETILRKLWRLTAKKIIYYIFVPFLVQFTLFLIYQIWFFKIRKNQIEDCEEDCYVVEKNDEQWYLLSPCLLIAVYFLVIEFKQLSRLKVGYFKSFRAIWNYLDFTVQGCLIVNIISIFFTLNFGRGKLVLSGFTSLLIWLKMLYFMRIFHQTSHFIKMLMEIIYDIRYFLLVFSIGILAFANFYYLVNLGNMESVQEFNEDTYLNSIIYTYMQALGEFNQDNFEDAVNGAYYWTALLLLTFFLTITLLNLLIAIMGDTFDKVLEVSEESKLKDIAAFIADYAFLFPLGQFKKRPYFIVAKLQQKQEEEEDWQGKIQALKNFVKETKEITQENILERIEYVRKTENHEQQALKEQNEALEREIKEGRTQIRKVKKQQIQLLKLAKKMKK